MFNNYKTVAMRHGILMCFMLWERSGNPTESKSNFARHRKIFQRECVTGGFGLIVGVGDGSNAS